jgi:hypothetical protein
MSVNKTILPEEWRFVPDRPGYEVSDLGRVRNSKTGRILERDYPSGYPRVTMGKGFRRLVHSLVLTVFVGPRPSPSHDACHENGVRSDCVLSNLRWDTKSANQADRFRHGTHDLGERSARAKVTDRQVDFIRRAYRPRTRSRGARAIAKRLKLHPVTVERIARRESRDRRTDYVGQ